MTNATPNMPDLSLQIRPPFTKPGLMKNYMGTERTDSGSSGGSSDLSHEYGLFSQETSCHRSYLSLGLEMVSSLNPPPPRKFQHYPQHISNRDFKRTSSLNGVMKRSARAPRMRWTSTLHSHFVHAVQLLGGHESMLL